MTLRHSDVARRLAKAITGSSPWVELASGQVMCRWCHVQTKRATVAPDHQPECPVAVAEAYIAHVSRKRCSRCENVKDIAEFPRDRTRTDGRGAYCRPCKQQANEEGALRRAS